MELRSPTRSEIAKCVQEIYFIGKSVINGKDQRVRLIDDTINMLRSQNPQLPKQLMPSYVCELAHDRDFCQEAGLDYSRADTKDIAAGIAYFFRLQIDPDQQGPYLSYMQRTSPQLFKR